MKNLLLCFLVLLAAPVAVLSQNGYQAPWDYYNNGDGTCWVTGYGVQGDPAPPAFLTFPTNINGLLVTGIFGNAFHYYTTLAGVAIPGTVTNISADAFFSSSVTSVVIPASVTSAVGAFAFCSRLTNVVLASGCSMIDATEFDGCSGLVSITIPASITAIASSAFEDCSSLSSVLFLGNAPNAADEVFYGDPGATVYYLSGTSGWTSTFSSLPTVVPVVWDRQIETGGGNFGVIGDQFGFNISGPPSISVVIQACTNLLNPVWVPLSTNTLNGGLSFFADPQWTNYPGRFYRLNVP
jgi:hypothetical protein